MLKILTVAVASLYATAIMVEQVSSNNKTCIGEFCFTTPGSNEVKDFYDAKSWCNEQDTTLAIVNDSYTQAAFTQYLHSSNIGLMSFVNLRLDQYANTWFLVNGSKYQGNVGSQDVDQYKVFCYLRPLPTAEFLIDASNPTDLRKYVCNFERTKCLSNSTSNILFMGICYTKYENENVTWYQARERCIEYGGDLAQFQNGSKSWIPPFDTFWLNQSLEYWVGIRWNGWSWKYPDGSELIYSSWSNGKPNNYNYQCVCVDPNGIPAWSWTDCDCSVQRPFVCLKIVPITTVSRLPTTTLTTTTASTVAIYTTSATCKAEGLVVGLVLGLVIILPLTIIIVILIVCIVRLRRQLLDQRNNERETATVKASQANLGRSAATLDAADADVQYQQLKRQTMLGSDTNMSLYDQLNQPGNQI